MCWLQGSRSRSSKRMKQAAIEAAPDRAITKCYSRAPRYYAESNATHKSAGRTFDAPALHNRALHIMLCILPRLCSKLPQPISCSGVCCLHETFQTPSLNQKPRQ